MTHRRDETTDAAAQPPRFTTSLAEDAETIRFQAYDPNAPEVAVAALEATLAS